MEKPTPEQMKLFAAFGEISWLMPLTGVVEVIGGLLFIFPKNESFGRHYYSSGNDRNCLSYLYLRQISHGNVNCRSSFPYQYLDDYRQ